MRFTTAESCRRLGCCRVFPWALGQAPGGVRPRRLRSRSPRPPGTEGPVRRALRGSALPVQAAGSRLRSLKRAALAGRAASRTLQREGGIPSPPPSLPSPHPRPRGASAVLARALAGPGSGLRRAKLCSASGCPSRLGCLLSYPWDTSRSPGDWGSHLASGTRKVSAFCLSEQRARCLPLLFLSEDGLLPAARVQPFLTERGGFPHSGSFLLLLSGNPPPPGRWSRGW